MSRIATISRETAETAIRLELDLDGGGRAEVDTGIGFLDHMIESLAKHSGFDVALVAKGDLHVDDHHTSEDTALTLGAALDQALGDRAGIRRFGSAYVPLDEALARSVVDLSGRPYSWCDLGLSGERLGTWSTQNVGHFFGSLATAGRLTLHLDVLRGENDHHRCEAAFKALALALREAVGDRGIAGVPSTKGVL